MQQFRVEQIREKLAKLNPSQESVQSTAFYFRLHKLNAREIIQVWLEFCGSGDKLSLLYLANEVIQTDDSLFREEFRKVLPAVFEQKFKFASVELKSRVARVLRVWKERNVYTSEFVDELEKLIGYDDSNRIKKTSKRGSIVQNSAISALATKMTELDQLVAKKVPQITKINSQSSVSINDLKVLSYEEQSRKKGDLVGLLQGINEYNELLEAESQKRADAVKELERLLLDQTTMINVFAGQFEMIKGKKAEVEECLAFVSRNVDGNSNVESKNLVASALERINAISAEPVEF